ncbi:WAT1-related protein [Apostasia shenzhenica]|uniref:WAT1-related protein n=1 Tax=Apostasia shenzhenica TaxID=1088818 RepID=A0A2I0A364_9ASPA|nr:WAT1-related protein [Apostasia shenzhenica]
MVSICDGGLKLLLKLQPYTAMTLMQSGFAGMHVISLLTLKNGMSQSVLVVYRNVVAATIIAPFALWFERPVLDQNFYYMGAKMTSASFVAAIENLNPSITFMLALLLRVEKLDLRGRHGKAKLIGPLLTFCGAILMVLYKGPILEFIWTKGRGAPLEETHDAISWSLIEGTSMILVSCISWSFFLILQGVVCNGLSYYILGMVMKEKGPVFASAFSPLSLIITFILGSIVLAEQINLGMVLGAAIMLTGLYSLLWGKTKDHVNPTQPKEETNVVEPKSPIAASDHVEQVAIDISTVIRNEYSDIH